jgi:hypothetical protein
MCEPYQIDECSICLDIIETNWRELYCSHKYHEICIDKWLERSSRCPLCMRDVREMEEMDEREIVNIQIKLLCISIYVIICISIIIIYM